MQRLLIAVVRFLCSHHQLNMLKNNKAEIIALKNTQGHAIDRSVLYDNAKIFLENYLEIKGTLSN